MRQPENWARNGVRTRLLARTHTHIITHAHTVLAHTYTQSNDSQNMKRIILLKYIPIFFTLLIYSITVFLLVL